MCSFSGGSDHSDIFCQWVNKWVDRKKLSQKYCTPHWHRYEGNDYLNCDKSIQLTLGLKTPEELIQQLQEIKE